MKTIFLLVLALFVWPMAASAQTLVSRCQTEFGGAATTDSQECPCRYAEAFMCENFESRVVGSGETATQMNQARFKNSGWSYSNTSGNLGNIVTTPVAFGTKALRINYAQGDNGGSGFIDTNVTGHTDYYVRFYAYWSASFPLGCQNGISGFGSDFNKYLEMKSSGASNGDHLYHFAHCNSQAEIVDQDGVVGLINLPQNVGSPVTVARGVYTCVEHHVKINSTTSTADAVFEGWLDGVKVFNYTNFIMTPIEVGPHTLFRYTSSGSPNIYGANDFRMIDNIVVATSRIGCIGAAAPPGLNAPANLLICNTPGCNPAMVVPLGALVGLLAWARRRLKRRA